MKLLGWGGIVNGRRILSGKDSAVHNSCSAARSRPFALSATCSVRRSTHYVLNWHASWPFISAIATARPQRKKECPKEDPESQPLLVHGNWRFCSLPLPGNGRGANADFFLAVASVASWQAQFVTASAILCSKWHSHAKIIQGMSACSFSVHDKPATGVHNSSGINCSTK